MTFIIANNRAVPRRRGRGSHPAPGPAGENQGDAMLSHSSITSRRQARGWAKRFLGAGRQNAEPRAALEGTALDPPRAAEAKPVGEAK